MPSDQRQTLLSDLEITALKNLALKSNLCHEEYEEVSPKPLPPPLTFHHRPLLLRWLSEAGVKVASEKQQRALSKELVTTEVVGEIAPFTHSIKGGGEEVKKSAMVYIPNLQDKIKEILEQLAR
jgi:hypothetical protein